jgi:hypothetical protein
LRCWRAATKVATPLVAAAQITLQRGVVMIIKRIGVLKLAIFQGCAMALFGVIIALFFLLFGSMLSGLAGNNAGGVLAGGIFMLILLPIFYAVFGFIAGAIGAAIYNLVAGMVGGIELDVE